MFGKRISRKATCLSELCGPLYTGCVHESRSLEFERTYGGNFHPRLLINVTPIANKYHAGNMKRTLKRGLKVLEIAELEANDVWVP